MKTDIINRIRSLNNTSFSDYQLLVTDIRDIIMDLGRQIKSQAVEHRDGEMYIIDVKSLDYIKEVFNDKLSEYRAKFLLNEELIRNEMVANPKVLDEVRKNIDLYVSSLFYSAKIEPMDRPGEIHKTRSAKDAFIYRYENGIYSKPKESRPSSNSEGCFVATYAYNSYEHHDVWVLRKFRDEVLMRDYFGMKFIKLYYLTSPSLIKVFEFIRFPKAIIRLFLEQMIIRYLR